jgi:hypothetical protein
MYSTCSLYVQYVQYKQCVCTVRTVHAVCMYSTCSVDVQYMQCGCTFAQPYPELKFYLFSSCFQIDPVPIIFIGMKVHGPQYEMQCGGII